MIPLRLATTAVAVIAVLVLPLGPAAASQASSPTHVVASTLGEAREISREARALRSGVATLLGDYLTTYGDRFNENDKTELTALKASADRQLAVVVVTANRLRNAIADGSTPAQIRAATQAAQRAQTRAKSTAEASFARARAIVEPKLSLFEGLHALSDYTRMIDRFDALAERTDAIARDQRSNLSP